MKEMTQQEGENGQDKISRPSISQSGMFQEDVQK